MKRLRPPSNQSIKNERAKLLKFCHARIRLSIENEYYLEAISLIDSVITDRLESILSRSLEADPKFRTLGEAIKDVKKLQLHWSDSELLDELERWSWRRNRWLHEVAKISSDESWSVSERISEMKCSAVDGSLLLKRLISQDKKFGQAL